MWLCTPCLAARSVTHDLVNSSRSFHTDWADGIKLARSRLLLAPLTFATATFLIVAACDRPSEARRTGSRQIAPSSSIVLADPAPPPPSPPADSVYRQREFDGVGFRDLVAPEGSRDALLRALDGVRPCLDVLFRHGAQAGSSSLTLRVSVLASDRAESIVLSSSGLTPDTVRQSTICVGAYPFWNRSEPIEFSVTVWYMRIVE